MERVLLSKWRSNYVFERRQRKSLGRSLKANEPECGKAASSEIGCSRMLALVPKNERVSLALYTAARASLKGASCSPYVFRASEIADCVLVALDGPTKDEQGDQGKVDL